MVAWPYNDLAVITRPPGTVDRVFSLGPFDIYLVLKRGVRFPMSRYIFQNFFQKNSECYNQTITSLKTVDPFHLLLTWDKLDEHPRHILMLVYNQTEYCQAKFAFILGGREKTGRHTRVIYFDKHTQHASWGMGRRQIRNQVGPIIGR